MARQGVSVATVFLVGSAFLVLMLDASGTLPAFFHNLGGTIASLRPTASAKSSTAATTTTSGKKAASTSATAKLPWWKRIENGLLYTNPQYQQIAQKAMKGG